MILVSNRWGGLDNRHSPNLIGPNLAADLSNVVLDAHTIAPLSGPGDSVASLAGTVRSAYKFNGTWILSTEARQYVETAGMLIYAVSGQHPKKTTDGTTWHNLGIQKPQAGPTVAAGAAGNPSGTYSCYVTFVSTLGGESAPSAAGTVTVTAQKIEWSAIPTHIGLGDITDESDEVTNVTNISAWQVGMRIIGQIAAGTSAPAASVGIPAGATITAINGTTITLSAAATATASGIRLTDPQFTSRKLYRAGAATNLITPLPDMTTLTYSDNTADADVGAALATLGYVVPVEFDAISVSPTGVLLGAKGRVVYPSESALPHAFSTVSFTCNETVRALGNYAGAFAILTLATIYILDGTTPANFTLTNTPSQQGCLDRDTVVDMGDVLIYRSPDGICAFNGRDSDVISKQFLSDAFMVAISTSNNKAVRHNERYYLFHAAGFLVWDPRQEGSPWNKGDLGADEATAAHYDRTADTLYVVVPTSGTSHVKAWEGGSALTWTYKTGDWHGSAEGLEDFFRSGRIVNNGAVTLTATVDGTAGTANTFTRATLGPSDFFISKRGLELSMSMTGTGTVRAIYAELGSEAQRL